MSKGLKKISTPCYLSPFYWDWKPIYSTMYHFWHPSRHLWKIQPTLKNDLHQKVRIINIPIVPAVLFIKFAPWTFSGVVNDSFSRVGVQMSVVLEKIKKTLYTCSISYPSNNVQKTHYYASSLDSTHVLYHKNIWEFMQYQGL